MRIYRIIRSIKDEYKFDSVGAQLLGLFQGDECVTAEDRCIALASLCEHLLDRIQYLEQATTHHGLDV